ncbi:hypothetical protein AK812_SmicGene25625 [Symbiodinium microadriaticum]|uniref:Uncharacterized protein n=1 Tax=Symbiodinium microadriaticum TaxID=2951 RepID=A0A1Q9DBN9_SYMMI|nr:hypothetical protein AK812_SmicGene25625 [Symbiodinium microadriaticum]
MRKNDKDEPQPPETEPPDEKITRFSAQCPGALVEWVKLDDPESDESPAKITRLDDEESQFSDIVTESLAVPAGGEVPPEPQPARPDGPDPEEPEVNPPPDDPIPQPPDDPPLPQLPREHLKAMGGPSRELEHLSPAAARRVLSYSWCFILLLTRFAVIIYAMLMRRDLAGLPLVYMLITLGYVILEATLQPYVWTYLNDWAPWAMGRFLLFVISGWSDTASEVLVVVATLAAIIPVILRFLILFLGEEDTEDPTDMSIARGGMEHVRKYIELAVKKRHITVVEKTLDDSGQEVERTTHTEEVETEGVTYSFDMTKSEVFKVMQGEKDQKPRPDQGLCVFVIEVVSLQLCHFEVVTMLASWQSYPIFTSEQATLIKSRPTKKDRYGRLIPLTDLDVQSEVLSDDEEIHELPVVIIIMIIIAIIIIIIIIIILILILILILIIFIISLCIKHHARVLGLSVYGSPPAFHLVLAVVIDPRLLAAFVRLAPLHHLADPCRYRPDWDNAHLLRVTARVRPLSSIHATRADSEDCSDIDVDVQSHPVFTRWRRGLSEPDLSMLRIWRGGAVKTPPGTAAAQLKLHASVVVWLRLTISSPPAVAMPACASSSATVCRLTGGLANLA